jgi:hypothetical protein
MFGKGRYFGLRGSKLNYAVGIIAGIDFLYVLFFVSTLYNVTLS